MAYLINDGFDGAVCRKGEPRGSAGGCGAGVLWARARRAGRGPGRPRGQGAAAGVFGIAVDFVFALASSKAGFLATADDAAIAVANACKASVLGTPAPDATSSVVLATEKTRNEQEARHIRFIIVVGIANAMPARLT